MGGVFHEVTFEDDAVPESAQGAEGGVCFGPDGDGTWKGWAALGLCGLFGEELAVEEGEEDGCFLMKGLVAVEGGCIAVKGVGIVSEPPAAGIAADVGGFGAMALSLNRGIVIGLDGVGEVGGLEEGDGLAALVEGV